MKGVDFNNKTFVKERLKHAFEYLFEIVKLCIIQTPTTMQHQMCSSSKPVSYITITQDAVNSTLDDAFERKITATDEKSVLDIAVEKFAISADDDEFFTGKYLKKYWINKQYADKANIKDVKTVTLIQMLDDLKDFYYGRIGA